MVFQAHGELARMIAMQMVQTLSRAVEASQVETNLFDEHRFGEETHCEVLIQVDVVTFLMRIVRMLLGLFNQTCWPRQLTE